MRYGRLITVVDHHTVSATEAAYSSLFGLYVPRLRAPSWGSTIGINIEEEEWLVETFEAGIFNASDKDRLGRLVYLMAAHSVNVGPSQLPQRQFQSYGSRVVLERPVYVNQGLCIMVRNPAVVDTDRIRVSFSYRRVYDG